MKGKISIVLITIALLFGLALIVANIIEHMDEKEEAIEKLYENGD